jgi:hypothetical protein
MVIEMGVETIETSKRQEAVGHMGSVVVRELLTAPSA